MNAQTHDILNSASQLAHDSLRVIECATLVSNPADQCDLLNKAIAMLVTAADECRRVKTRLTIDELDRSEAALRAHAKNQRA